MAKRGMGRAYGRLEAALPAIGTWLLILLGVGIYGTAVALAGIAVFRDYLPEWFMDWVHDFFFAGNRKVDLTLQLLEDWGLIDLLKNTVVGAVVFCVALFGLLILVHLVILWSRNRKRKRLEAAAKALRMPRIRLKRPLTVTIEEEGSETLHRYHVQIELVVKKKDDIQPVIATLSNLKVYLLRSADAVIRASYAKVDQEAMAQALTRAAKDSTGAAIDRVEVGHITYLKVDKTTGTVISGRSPQAAAATAAAEQATPDTPTTPSGQTAPAATAGAANGRVALRRRPVSMAISRPGAVIARILPKEPPQDAAPAAQAAAPGSEAAPAEAEKAPAPGEASVVPKTAEDVEVEEDPEEEPAPPGLGVDIKKLKEVMSSLRS
ncbi:MAG: hypothetical protein HYR63_26715 [Proteobacteria bacterium]|nr:hypothetical protein [Pseudomonadota bacterium]